MKGSFLPYPQVCTCWTFLAGAKCFFTLDLANGYWQVGLTEEAKEKTAFVTSCIMLYQFKVLPFRLCNATLMFEQWMERILKT